MLMWTMDDVVLAGVQPTWLVSVLRLLDVRSQFPLRLVCRLLHRRTIPHHSLPAKASANLSTEPGQGRRLVPGLPGACAVQLRNLDVGGQHDRPTRPADMSGEFRHLCACIRFT